MISFQEFLQYIAKNGVARTNRFQVIIPLPSSLLPSEEEDEEDTSLIGTVIKTVTTFLGGSAEITRGLDLMVDSANIPGKNLTTTDVKYNGDHYHIPYSNVYEAHDFTFKCSRDMYEKNIIDEWMNLVFNPTTHEISYMDDYTTDITINQLNEKDEIIQSIILVDAYPSLCSPITMTTDENNSFAKLQVQFLYKRWRKAEENINRTDGIDSLAQSPLGPILSPFLSNPAIQSALTTLEDQVGLDLEGEAVNIYNQIDTLVRGTTGASINNTATILESMKAQIGINGTISNLQKSALISKVNDILNNLRG